LGIKCQKLCDIEDFEKIEEIDITVNTVIEKNVQLDDLTFCPGLITQESGKSHKDIGNPM
jgi:hypothetical protein